MPSDLRVHYTNPACFSGRTYCGQFEGRRVSTSSPVGPTYQFRDYHLTTCPECIAKGPRLYLTEGNGYAVEAGGYLRYVSPPAGGQAQVGTPVPSTVKFVKIGGK